MQCERRSTRTITVRRLLCLLAAGAALIASDAAVANDDWLQWGGPNRDFKVDTRGLADKWPDSGPEKLWTRSLGDGYSAIVSDGRSLYTMYSIREKDEQDRWVNTGKEVVISLDARTGKTQWEHQYETTWSEQMGMEFGPGPHATPLIDGERVYTVGCTARVHCLDKSNGKVRWSVDLAKKYGLEPFGRGYASSPIAYKNTIILPIGGEYQSIIALSKDDGSEAWKNQSFGVTLSSSLFIEMGEKTQLVIITAAEVSGLNPENGELLWTHPHETQYGANISTPVWCNGDILFISSAYGMGARGLKLTTKNGKTTVEELWFNPKVKIHHGNAVHLDGYVYCTSGDFGPAFLVAVDVKTGELAWRKRGLAKANFLHADGKLIILDEDGFLALATVDPDDLNILSKVEMCARNAWTVPTLVGKTLYVRDRKMIMALDLG